MWRLLKSIRRRGCGSAETASLLCADMTVLVGWSDCLRSVAVQAPGPFPTSATPQQSQIRSQQHGIRDSYVHRIGGSLRPNEQTTLRLVCPQIQQKIGNGSSKHEMDYTTTITFTFLKWMHQHHSSCCAVVFMLIFCATRQPLADPTFITVTTDVQGHTIKSVLNELLFIKTLYGTE